MFIDTHCHISKEYYDMDKLMSDMNDNYMIYSGDSNSSNLEVLESVNNYKNVYGVIGYHPEYADEINDLDLSLLEQQIKNNKIVGIGEIGLDYYWNKENKEKQKKVFIAQIQLARKHNLPIVIHSRDSINDTYNIIKEYCHDMKIIMHCYSGSLEMAKELVKLGVRLGIGGVVTFKNAKNIIDVVKNIDLKYLLPETDSPYLTPVPFRGEKNSPLYIKYIIDKIASIKNISYEDVEKITLQNAIEQFDLDDIL